jgi:hypothetical protein
MGPRPKLQSSPLWACALLTLNLACSGPTSQADSGNPADSGAPSDAGVPTDAGLPVDGGAPKDAGLPNDAGPVADAGVLADAGPSMDGGADAGPGFTTVEVLNGDGYSILSWPVNANGNVAPTRIIAGSNTQLTSTDGLGADAQGNVYALNTSSIVVFAPSQSGNVAPARVISGSNVLPAGYAFLRLYVEPAGKIWVTTLSSGFPSVSDVRAFAPGANGNVAPVQVIAGANTTIGIGLSIVASGSTLYVCNLKNSAYSILTFDETANGNTAPTASFPAAQGVQCSQMAADGNGNLYVAEQVMNATVPTQILVFPPGATTPALTLVGAPINQLTNAAGLAVDAVGTMYVGNGNSTASSLLVFSPGADGGTPPIQDVSGSATTFVPSTGFGPYVALH